jgi:long-chain acyl-CoA synthetase
VRLPDATPPLAEMINRALARAADRPAIEFEGRWYNWGDLRRDAERVSELLDASGIGADAPVAFVPRNRPSSIATLLALLAAKRTVRMIYAFQSAEAIAREIARLEPAAAILDATDIADPIVVMLLAEGLAGIVLRDSIIEAIAGAEFAGAKVKGRKGPDEQLIEILTSGTTGPPKQFPIRHRMIAENMVGAAALEPQAQEAAAALPPYLLYFPLGNISGIYSTIPTLIRGQRACLLDRFSVAAWHDYVLRHRPAHSGIPPSTMRALLDADIPASDLASIKAMGVGAAPLDIELQREFEDRYGIPILLSYGATEFGGPVCAWSPELHAEWGREKIGSVGRPILGARLRVVDAESGAEIAAGNEGKLEVVSPRIGPDWIKTSDIAVIDGDGFLFLRGRADGAIMRGGFKILPETIERALLQHNAIAEAAVVEVRDQRLGQVPGAAIVLKADFGALAQNLLESHLRSLLPATHIPLYWHFCDTLPCNASMKIDRAAIRRIFNDINTRQAKKLHSVISLLTPNP